MNTLSKYVLLLMVAGGFSCSSSEYMVESDYSYEGRFHKYRTFEFASNDNFTGSLDDRKLFEKYVGSVLSAWGYRNKEKRPDFYVFYSIYYDDLTMKGYNQPDLKQWSGLNGQYIDQIENFDSIAYENAIDTTRSRKRRQLDYDAINFDMKEGTILISFFDRRKEKTVWQGYASGVFGSDKIKNERTLRSAIIKIMDEFKYPTFSI